MSFINKLAGKTVVIVGGSSGYFTPISFKVNGRIGFGIAEAVASLGSKATKCRMHWSVYNLYIQIVLLKDMQ
jgi:NAD(P)-dependent dehydrogenase (short-subunit alcohol dehydrogenase family)